MSDFPPTIEELLETFEDLQEWDERYDFIIDLGRELPKMPSEYQDADHIVEGCMSTVWLTLNPVDSESGDPSVDIQASSDSMIVKGLIVLLLSLYQGKTPSEVVAVDPQAFFGQLGLNQHLSPNRRNGLFSMVGRIRELSIKIEAAS